MSSQGSSTEVGGELHPCRACTREVVGLSLDFAVSLGRGDGGATDNDIISQNILRCLIDPIIVMVFRVLYYEVQCEHELQL